MFDPLYRFLTDVGYTDPLHPSWTHIPIGLVIGAFVFGVVAFIFRSTKLTIAARYAAILALIFTFPTMLFGFMDWQHYMSGGWLFPIKMKLILAGILVGLLLLAAVIGAHSPNQHISVLVIYVLCLAAVTGLGWYGAHYLVYGQRVIGVSQEYRAGAEIFVNRCWDCHPAGGNVIAPQLQLRTSQKLNNFDSFLGWIRHPNPPMPPFTPSRMPDEQARELYSYIVNVLRGQPP